MREQTHRPEKATQARPHVTRQRGGRSRAARSAARRDPLGPGRFLHVDALGNGTLITRGARPPHFARPGQVVDFPIDFLATAYDAPAGHHIAAVIDTHDSLYSHPSHDHLDMRLVFDATRAATPVLPALR